MSQAEFNPSGSRPEEIQRLMRQAQALVSLAEKATTFAKSIQPYWPAIQQTLRQMAELNSAAGILARQQGTMATIAASFQPLPVPTTQELHEAEVALRTSLPQAPEQIQEIVQLAESITVDPEQQKLIERMTGTLKQADLSKVPPIAIPVLLYWWLCHVLGLPLSGEVTPVQAANYLGVITLVFTVFVSLWPRG
jgi:hypothetical protein